MRKPRNDEHGYASVQSRFAETLTLTLNPNFGESGFGESGRHRQVVRLSVSLYVCLWSVWCDCTLITVILYLVNDQTYYRTISLYRAFATRWRKRTHLLRGHRDGGMKKLDVGAKIGNVSETELIECLYYIKMHMGFHLVRTKTDDLG